MKRAIYPLYAPQDESKVRPILAALKEKGVTVRTSPGKGDGLVLFLSEHVSGDGPVADRFVRLSAGRDLVIPVNLDGSPIPEDLQSALMARHGLDGRKYGTQELADLIARAAKGDGKSRLPLILSLIGTAVLLTVGGIILFQKQYVPPPPLPPTPIPVTPTPTPEPVFPEEVDLTLQELENVFELIIVGDSFHAYKGDEEWMQGTDRARVGAEQVANRSFEDGAAHWYSTEDGHEFTLHDWGDLGFLPYMKNLGLLTLIDVNGTLPDLSGLEKLGCVELFDCAIDDISGVRGAGLQAFNYKGPAMDLSPLNECAALNSMVVELYGSEKIDLGAFGPQSLRILHLQGADEARTADLTGLRSCRMLVEVHLERLPLPDLTCLSDAASLRQLELFEMGSLASLQGLELHERLQKVRIDSCHRLSDLSALNGCTALSEAFLEDCPIRDLAFLAGARSLLQLELRNMETLRSFHGLEDHRSLKWLRANELWNLTDVSALSSCSELMQLHMQACFALADITPVTKLPKLQYLMLFGTSLADVNFLWDIQNKEYFSFGIAEVDDWSGLAAIEKYNILNITDRNGSSLQYLQNATVIDFEFFNRLGRGNQNEGLDITRLPHVTKELYLYCVTSLEGLDQPDVQWLTVEDCPYLTSLKGVEGMDRLTGLAVRDCPRLTDWSALDGRKLNELDLEALFTLPDFSALSAKEISLTTIYDLKDLSCFQGFAQDGYALSLLDVDGVTDLSPLYHLHGKRLKVPAQLQEQAQAMVDSGLLDEYEVQYPEGWWEPIQPHIELLNLGEIDTLPSALLARIDRLTLAGDQVAPEGAWVEEDYSSYPPALYLRYDGSEERTMVEPGTLTDLTRLEKLTGLRELRVYAQPRLTSLEGIQAMGGLTSLEVNQAPSLADASAAFTVQSLEELSLRFTATTSLQGVQNLYALRRLHVNDSPVADLSPLTACPALEDVNFFLPMMTFEELKAQPEIVRRNIRSLSVAGEYVYDGGSWWFETDWATDPPALYLHNDDTDERLPLVAGAVTDIGELTSLLPGLEQLNLFGQDLTTLDGMENFPRLRQLTIEECRRITDFSALWRTASLEDISLRNEPVESIEGIERLPHLVSLSLSGTRVKDFSPLTRVEYSYCTSEENDGRGFWLALDVAGSDALTCEDYGVLEAVPVYWGLNMNNVPVGLWLDHVMGKEIRQLSCHRCGMTDEQLRAFVQAHPLLKQLDLRWNPQLTDLSCLRELRDLWEVQVSQEMTEAVASLGEGCPFQVKFD